MKQEKLKQTAARAALDFVQDGMIVGVGTGSTVNYFIDALADIKMRIRGAVSSSLASESRLTSHGIPVFDLNDVEEIPIYIDGADEIAPCLSMIKGGGGALTREKIVAGVASRFICICDDSKRVSRLGRFPLPVEIIPMARTYVSRTVKTWGGQAILRDKFVTDNCNWIIDIHGLNIDDPVTMETLLNQIPGVVTNGLFAQRGADVLLLAGESGVTRIDRI